jgi:hypothetical protein
MIASFVRASPDATLRRPNALHPERASPRARAGGTSSIRVRQGEGGGER